MKEYLQVGKIVSTHALKGEVKIFSTTDFKAERYREGNTLYLEQGGTYIPMKVKTHRTHQTYDLVQFEGYDDIDKILPFVKCPLYIEASQLEDLNEDEYYYYKLLGCDVYHEETLIGKVSNIVNYGASDILVITSPTQKEYMVPFVDEFIIGVHLDLKRIDIHVIEGLLD